MDNFHSLPDHIWSTVNTHLITEALSYYVIFLIKSEESLSEEILATPSLEPLYSSKFNTVLTAVHITVPRVGEAHFKLV